MSVKPEFAFDVCWDVYCGAREALDGKQGISALDWSAPMSGSKSSWKPDVQPRIQEFVADFGLAGKAALGKPEQASRLVLFNLYYLGLAEYAAARHFLGIGEIAWVQWTEEIRRVCGKEMLRRGLYPPKKYFQEFQR